MPHRNSQKHRQKFIPAAHFKILTPLYDVGSEWLGFGKGYRKKLMNILKIPNAKHNILDAGCATGTFSIELKKSRPAINLNAIDADPEILLRAVAKAKKEKVKIAFKNAFIQHLPFEDNFFDIAYSSLVFHHLPHEIKIKATAEIFRVLKPGGKFVLADFGNPQNIFEFFYPLLALVTEEGYDNYHGNLPAILHKKFLAVTEIGRYKRGIVFLQAEK